MPLNPALVQMFEALNSTPLNNPEDYELAKDELRNKVVLLMHDQLDAMLRANNAQNGHSDAVVAPARPQALIPTPEDMKATTMAQPDYTYEEFAAMLESHQVQSIPAVMGKWFRDTNGWDNSNQAQRAELYAKMDAYYTNNPRAPQPVAQEQVDFQSQCPRCGKAARKVTMRNGTVFYACAGQPECRKPFPKQNKGLTWDDMNSWLKIHFQQQNPGVPPQMQPTRFR